MMRLLVHRSRISLNHISVKYKDAEVSLTSIVVCDSTNNPPEAIDRGEFYAEIYVKPTRSINFITLTFVATRTGTTFAEIVS